MNIYEKLIEVRKSVPYLQKENEGKQYNYVSSSQVLSNLRQAMNDNKLLLVPKIIGKNVTSDTVNKSDNYGEKHTTTYFTELTMEFVWINAEKPEETIVCPWYGQGVDIAGEKGVGKALTYAEKYFMLKFFNIPTDKDDPDSFQEKDDIPGHTPKTHEEGSGTTKPISEGNKYTSIKCEGCGAEISEKIAMFSTSKYHKKLCYNCQKKLAKEGK